MGQRARCEIVARDFSGRTTRPNRAVTSDWPDAIARPIAPGVKSTNPANVLRNRLRSETARARAARESPPRRFSARTMAHTVELGAATAKTTD